MTVHNTNLIHFGAIDVQVNRNSRLPSIRLGESVFLFPRTSEALEALAGACLEAVALLGGVEALDKSC